MGPGPGGGGWRWWVQDQGWVQDQANTGLKCLLHSNFLFFSCVTIMIMIKITIIICLIPTPPTHLYGLNKRLPDEAFPQEDTLRGGRRGQLRQFHHHGGNQMPHLIRAKHHDRAVTWIELGPGSLLLHIKLRFRRRIVLVNPKVGVGPLLLRQK